MNSTQQIWWNPNIICASLHLSFVLFFVAIIILLERLETVLARDLPSTNRAACKKHGGFEDSKETGCTPWFYTIPVKYRYKKTCTSNHFRHISPSCQTSRLVTNIQRLNINLRRPLSVCDHLMTFTPAQATVWCNYSLNHPAIISESVNCWFRWWVLLFFFLWKKNTSSQSSAILSYTKVPVDDCPVTSF